MQDLAQTINRHELFRAEELGSVVKIEAALIEGARQYFKQNNFTEVVVPHITAATGACENVNTLFGVDYFGKRGWLAQTGQLYLESLVPKLDRVFCIGPSFRAEAEADNRHLTEFPLLEMELQCNLDQLIKHIEGVFMSMLTNALKREQALSTLGTDISRLKSIKSPFKRVTYTQAVKDINSHGWDVKWGDDLKAIHEKTLCELYGNKPFFITHYPRAIKFFNMRTNAQDSKIVNSTDFILPYSGEAVGAAEREHEYEILYEKLESSAMLQQLKKLGGSIEDFKWYLDCLRENGSVPHAGCGIGLNRITQFVLGTQDIRGCTGFPLNSATLY